MAFEWKENIACVATYNVLEGENFLDEFEDADHPFKQAAGVKLKTLRYFPKTTSNPASGQDLHRQEAGHEQELGEDPSRPGRRVR
jgi:hypothetical protein